MALFDITGIQRAILTKLEEIKDALGISSNGSIADGVDSNIKATVKDFTNSNPLTVAIVDNNGDQILNFGGSTTAIENKLDTLHTDLNTTIHGDITSTNTKLDTLHTDLGTTIHTDLTNISGYVDGVEGLLSTLPVVHGEVYSSPNDFTAAYTSTTTLTLTGLPFTPDTSTYIMAVAVQNSSSVWTRYFNGHNTTRMSCDASGVVTVTLASGTPFAATDLNYRVVIVGQKKAYDLSTDTDKITEQAALNTKYQQDSIVDTTNVAAATNYYPSSTGMSMDGFKDMSLTGTLIDADGTMTLTVEASNDEDTTNANWIQVYGYDCLNNAMVNSWTITNGTLTFAIDFESFNFSNFRIVMVNNGASNTAIIKMRRKAL